MKKISSFQADHTKIKPGIYLARIDGDIRTYDLRTRTPNAGDYMSHLTMHSVEHMLATFLRNSEAADRVIYFGPMGCQTGFYLLMRDTNDEEVISLVKKVLKQTVEHTGDVFGNTLIECGNYQNLSIESAKEEAWKYLQTIEDISAVAQYENAE